MSHWEWITASIVLTIGTARLTRLITYDSYPPVAWFRAKWDGWMDEGGNSRRAQWAVLMTCPFCLAPWLVLINGLVGWASDLHPVWWVFNGWLAASYLAAIVVAYDQPGE